MELAAKMDDWGKPAWIAATVFAFIVFWPVGLALLAYLFWSGRMGCSRMGGRGRWHGCENGGERSARSSWFRGRRGPPSSGNIAFDEYREETLRRLEEEQKGFVDFLDNLRRAKDKAEFDQYMAERRNSPPTRDEPDLPDGPEPQPQA